jgi:uncharacterized protein (DUF362 family)
MKQLDMTRRKVLLTSAALTGISAASALLGGCAVAPAPLASTGAAAEERQPANLPLEAGSGKSQVAFIKTDDRASGVQRALGLMQFAALHGKRVVVKPNCNSADPAPGSTHPDVLRTAIAHLQQRGAAAITVADRSGMADTQSAMEQIGIYTLAQEMGFEVVVLDDLAEEDWTVMQPLGSHWQRGFPFARIFSDADAVVQLCCLKTHRYGGHFTLSLKNSVGMVAKVLPGDGYNYMNELHSSPHQRLMIAEINTAYTPTLVIMDGVEAFVNGGPDTGKKVQSNVVLAGTDRVALDAVGVALLRYWGTTPEVSRGPIFQQEQIARAVQLGLGAASPEQIELITDDAESAAYAAQIRTILALG